jgi:hypothetical protein
MDTDANNRRGNKNHISRLPTQKRSSYNITKTSQKNTFSLTRIFITKNQRLFLFIFLLFLFLLFRSRKFLSHTIILWTSLSFCKCQYTLGFSMQNREEVVPKLIRCSSCPSKLPIHVFPETDPRLLVNESVLPKKSPGHPLFPNPEYFLLIYFLTLQKECLRYPAALSFFL